MVSSLISALGFDQESPMSLRKVCKITSIPSDRIRFYQDSHVLPSDEDLNAIKQCFGIDRVELCLKMGIFDHKVRQWLSENAANISNQFTKGCSANTTPADAVTPCFQTRLGRLYNTDCLNFLPTVKSQTVDLVFADPPFNLNKCYGDDINDKLVSADYEQWCQQWLDECVRVLKPGGSLFIWHVPRWSQKISAYLSQFLEFRHWVAVKMNCGLPISGRLYPSHYSLLYFTKGKKPEVFEPDRIPMDACKHCGLEQKDYGGHKNKLNPSGMNLQDVWLDINPVKHNKKRIANELPMNLLDRVIEMSTRPGDLILDPFGGSGVSYVVAEIKRRKWIGSELGNIDPILDRFADLSTERAELIALREEANKLFTDPVRQIRLERNIWIEPPGRVKNI